MMFFDDKKPYVITSIIGIIIAVAICFYRGIFVAESLDDALVIFSDAFLIPGVVFLGLGLILHAVNEGIFNGLAFGFKNIGRSFTAKKGEKIREEEFYQYNSRVSEKQIETKPMIFVGIGFMIISIMIVVIYML